jgi:hypothetical protein
MRLWVYEVFLMLLFLLFLLLASVILKNTSLGVFVQNPGFFVLIDVVDFTIIKSLYLQIFKLIHFQID